MALFIAQRVVLRIVLCFVTVFVWMGNTPGFSLDDLKPIEYSSNILLSLNNGAAGFGSEAECTDATIMIFKDKTIRVYMDTEDRPEIACLTISDEDYEKLEEIGNPHKIRSLLVSDNFAVLDGSTFYIALYDENDEMAIFKGGYMPSGKRFNETYQAIKDILEPYGIDETVDIYREYMEKGWLTENGLLEKKPANELLDLFVAGEIPAYYGENYEDSFYITNIMLDEEDAFSYHVGERVDLDNDGEDELVLDGVYGGMFLNVRDGKVFVLTQGDGTSWMLSYTTFDEKTWVVHYDIMHAGRVLYNFTLYDGKGQIVDEFDLNKEFWDTPEEPDGPNTVYTYRDRDITREEYLDLVVKLLVDMR